MSEKRMGSKDRRKAKQNTETSLAREVFEWILVIVISAALAFALDKFIIVNAKIPSASMEPTIMTGDRLIGSRLAYKDEDPQRGDVVIFLFPDKNIALQAEHPHLGQLSTRTIVSTLKFDIPKSKQEIEAERQRAEEKVSAIFGYNTDETNRISEDLKQYLQKLAQYGYLQTQISANGANSENGDSLQRKVQQASRYPSRNKKKEENRMAPLKWRPAHRLILYSVWMPCVFIQNLHRFLCLSSCLSPLPRLR